MKHAELRKRFQALSTSLLSDGLDDLGIPGALRGMRPRTSAQSFCGPAFTVSFRAARAGESAPAADYIDQVPANWVIVLDNANRQDCTVWGSLLTEYSQLHGIAGTVIWGACRDRPDIETLSYPVWSSGCHMRSCKSRAALDSLQTTLMVDGINIDTGYYVFGDADGVVVVPRRNIREVMNASETIAQREDHIRADIRAGSTLRDARRVHGYSLPASAPMGRRTQ